MPGRKVCYTWKAAYAKKLELAQRDDVDLIKIRRVRFAYAVTVAH